MTTTAQDYLDLIRDCSTQMQARYRDLDKHHHDGGLAPALPTLVLRIEDYGTFVKALPPKVRSETVAQLLDLARKGRTANIQLHVHASDPAGYDLQPYPLRDILTDGHN